MRSNFAGFSFEAWGPASDGERLKAALASFTAPYGATEKTNAEGATASDGTGNAGDLGLIPAGESVTSRYARTYDALISAVGFAHGHHGHTTATGTTDTGPPSTCTPGPSGYPGAPASSGVAMTEDGNVLALSAVRAMAPTAQIRRLIFDDRTGLPLDLGRAHRLAPGYLRTAAFIGHTTCAWNGGCDVPVSQCEADHITEFSQGGATIAANIQPLCSTHNRLKYRRTK